MSDAAQKKVQQMIEENGVGKYYTTITIPKPSYSVYCTYYPAIPTPPSSPTSVLSNT